MTAKEFLKSKGRREYESINGFTGEYTTTPAEMDEYAKERAWEVYKDMSNYQEEFALKMFNQWCENNK